MLRLLALAATLLAASAASAQDAADAALRHLRAEHAALGLSPADVADVRVQDVFRTRHNGVAHVHLQQRHAGFDVYGAAANVAVQDGRVLHAAVRFEPDAAARVETLAPTLPAPSAAEAAALALGLRPTEPFTVAASKAAGDLTLSDGGVARSPIPARLVLQPTEGGAIRLAWHLEIDASAASDWWSVRVDAETGTLLSRGNWAVDEAPRDEPRRASAGERAAHAFRRALAPLATGASAGTYSVFALPTESPIHGPRSTVRTAGDPVASPFGWHDTDGQPGADWTITKGNNVDAYEDTRDDNLPGYAPDGTDALRFDFPIDPAGDPAANRDAAITNLFYVVNRTHDILYHLGFDEAAGNFQERNYTGEGEALDAVQAEAQDGGGINNANFATPPDGRPPRMQMYTWDDGYVAEVTSPASLAGEYVVGRANFGPAIPARGMQGRVVLADDGSEAGTLACGPLVNAGAIAGHIALVDRGSCLFVDKVRNAQNAGARAVLVANNEPDGIITLGGDAPEITIPSGMISLDDGSALRRSEGTVHATLRPRALPLDGAFDNGVVIHEYVHGLTMRLTGGPAASDGLTNEEQMGEGWSDFFALALTQSPEGRRNDPRGLATFLLRQDPAADGLRSAPYTPDFGRNDKTYDDVRSARRTDEGMVVPHDVGEVWAAMLWDLYWAYVDRYGFDPDLVAGDGGNRRALQLVVDGLKFQPVRPGFVDARDALLAADRAATGGGDACLVWNVFARRGLGFSARQGDPDDVLDGVQAFDLPAACDALATADEDAPLPYAFAVRGTYPEPFNPTTTLTFDLPAPGEVAVEIYDLLGRRVRAVAPQALPAGRDRSLRIDAAGLASGVYVYRVTARTASGTYAGSGRMTLVR